MVKRSIAFQISTICAMWSSTELQRRHHLADALAGEIVEIAGFEDLRHLVLDVLRHALLVPALERGGERGGGLFDRLGGFQDAVGRVGRAFLDGRELLRDARHLPAVEAMILQRAHLAFGLLDRLIDDVEFDLELARLCGGDFLLRRRGFARSRRDHGAQRAQLGHQLGVA